MDIHQASAAFNIGLEYYSLLLSKTQIYNGCYTDL
jgi:hypothetical protein